MEKKKLFTYVEADENTPIQKLGLGDQLRFLIRKLSYDPNLELETDDAVTIRNLQLKANLLKFLRRATRDLRNGIHKSVTIELSNEFDPVLEEVLQSNKISKFYTYTIERPNIDYDIPYMVKLRLEVKYR